MFIELTIRLKAYADQVDQRLQALLPSAEARPEILHAAMRYSALAPGKRIRPAICLAACEAVGADSAIAIDAACAVEMVHAFSLIHDDLPALDNDDLRRGRPTCHVKFGEAVAILAGDALFSLAFQTLAEGPWTAEKTVEAVRRLTVASGTHGLVGGETLDILAEGKDVDAELLAAIHSGKTGALIACSASLGGLLAGGSGATVDALDGYGQALGLAFQIADDVLNETATPEQLGKSAGSDRERGKATYPALFGVSEARRMADDAADRAIEILRSSDLKSLTLEQFARFAVERLH